MLNSVQSSSRLFPPANVRPQVDETVRKILLKSTDSQVFFWYNHRTSKKRQLRGSHCYLRELKLRQLVAKYWVHVSAGIVSGSCGSR